MDPRFDSLDDFWPYYVAQHLKAATRKLHFAGTTCGLACLLLALLARDARWLAAGLFLSYGLAWLGHFFIEKNAPATFRYPLLSLRADFRLYRLMAAGRMESEIVRIKDRVRPYLDAPRA
jgi:hypothetical protein